MHLNGEECLEVVVLAGKRREVLAAAEDIRGVKGVLQGDYLIGVPAAIGETSGHHQRHRSANGG